jgi:two-component system, chemotaxis family, CheB/CheR fusion protein
MEENRAIGKHGFPVVGIGASAGGIESIGELLENLPLDTGFAYIYVQHLDPTHESNLPAILSRKTAMPVMEAEDKMKIAPDHLYIIPANTEIHLVDGSIAVTKRPKVPYSHMPINQFFTSLAENYKQAAIGVILSGTASDGTLGMKAIKMEGGLTIAQDESAKFQGMPKNAISEGAVHMILSPKQMAQELVRLGKQKHIYFSPDADVEDQVNVDEEAELRGIFQLLNRSVGVDFSQYKISTIKRRIAKRMALHRLISFKHYLQYMQQNQKEVKLLYSDFLINVTTFFRDEDLANFLQSQVIPDLVSNKHVNDAIRVWIPACSTGQEVYSIAILIVEAMQKYSKNLPVQIFATDLSESALLKARHGVYTKEELGNVSEDRLQRFFTKIDGSYRIAKNIRDFCIFAVHDLMKDPPFSRVDIVSCCNLLIYLDKPLQRKAFATFHYSLLENGYLILGKSETVGNSSHIFNQLDKKLKIFAKRKDTTSRALFDMNPKPNEIERDVRPVLGKTIPKTNSNDLDLEKAVDELLLKRFTPASVVVAPNLDIVQFRGSAGIYLQPAPGKASLNLVKMAKSGLAFDLHNIIHKARKSGEACKKSGIDLIEDGRNLKISIEAIPIKGVREEYYLIVFDEEKVIQYSDPESAANDRVRQLEAELVAVREDLRSIIESHEAANEELQSANEEVVSSNEELQSINEELETSKEEIESSNEELLTINQELSVRNEQLAEAQDYAQAIFSTIGESVVVLDADTRVKYANAAFYKTFKVTEEETEGQFLYDLGARQWNIAVLKDLLHSLSTEDKSIEGFVVKFDFPHIGNKIMRLNASRLRQQFNARPLTILAFEDITELVAAENNKKGSSDPDQIS